jgi:hypothetical protein
MKTQREALDEIAAMVDRVTIPPAVAAPAIGFDPQYIRDVARANPDALGFPVIVIKHRVKIPRVPFLEYLGYGGNAK